MTLEEALNAPRGSLLLLKPFEGFKPCGKLTGRYYYDTLLEKEDESDIKVEVRTWFFVKEWVHLCHLKRIKDK